MILKESKNIVVADNSGAVKIRCIGLFRGSRKRVAKLNDWVLLTVKRYNKKKKIKKKIIYFGLLVSLRYNFIRRDGIVFSFSNNRVLLFNQNRKFLGTRIYGPLCKEFKKNLRLWKFRDQIRRIISYSKYIF